MKRGLAREPKPDENCPCGKPQPARVCCWLNAEWRAEVASTRPKGAKTGYAHRGCYARALANCSTKLSREHYFSKTVLEAIGKNFSVYPDASKSEKFIRTPKALAAKILCERHNSRLSALDTTAGHVFWALRDINRAFGDAAPNDPGGFYLLNGGNFELWALKLACGLLASGNARQNGVPLRQPPELAWLEALFGERDIESLGSGAGLYIGVNTGALVRAGAQVSAALANHPHTGALVYLSFDVAGFEFLLFFGGGVFGPAGKADALGRRDSGSSRAGFKYGAIFISLGPRASNRTGMVFVNYLGPDTELPSILASR